LHNLKRVLHLRLGLAAVSSGSCREKLLALSVASSKHTFKSRFLLAMAFSGSILQGEIQHTVAKETNARDRIRPLDGPHPWELCVCVHCQ
jgi:hypothetical protein